MPEAKRWTRLSPEARRNQLLDIAAAVVADEGTEAMTMERVAEAAGVSKALVYRYFGRQSALLLELYERESDTQPLAERIRGARTFEDRLRAITAPYFDAVERSGLLFHRLVGERSIEEDVESFRRQTRAAVLRFWVTQLRTEGLDRQQAIAFATMFQAAVEAAGGLVARGEVDRDLAEEQFYESALAALEAAKRSDRSRVRRAGRGAPGHRAAAGPGSTAPRSGRGGRSS
jgi:AcrR family transcriptional regulator